MYAILYIKLNKWIFRNRIKVIYLCVTITLKSNVMTEHNDRILIDEKLTGMNTRLTKLEAQMASIDTKLTTVVDAILGNSLTKTGGFIEDIKTLKARIEVLEDQAEKAEAFKKRIIWTIGIVVAIAIVLEYLTQLYSNISGK